MTRTYRIPIAVAALAMVAAAPDTGGAQTGTRQRIDTTFAFAKGGWVDLGIVSGTIVVTGWTRQEARVVARIETGYIESSFSPNRIELSTRSERYSRSRSRMSNAQFEVSVPIGTRVMASAVSGDIRVRGTTAEVQANTVSGRLEIVDAAERVEARTVSGEIRLDRIRAHTRVGTTSGDMELSDLTGDLEIHAVSSDMQIRRVDATNLRIETTSGDVTYEGTIDPKGTYDISTHSGTVRFAIPSNVGATLSLQSFSGDIESAFPMTLQPGDNIIRRRRGQRMEFTIGSGGARVSITTFSGGITIERGSASAGKEE